MTQNKEVKTKTKIKISFKFSWRILNFVILALIVSGGVYYVTGINDLMVKGFKLQELKQEVSQLSENYKSLELTAMSLESYNNLTKRAGEMSMVAVGEEIDYITSISSIVAKK